VTGEELVIVAGGSSIAGWEDVELTLLAEGFPNSFSIGMSSGPAAAVPTAGDDCAIFLGGDVAITGYVDRVQATGDAMSHALRLSGRGKTQDLVDCSAEWPSAQIQGNALEIARKLAEPYGIQVTMGHGADPGPRVTPWALNFGETAAEIVQRVARNAGLLAYEDREGALVLATLGNDTAASGVAYGGNVQAWSVTDSMDGRFSDIVCCSGSVDAVLELPGGDFFWVEKDPNVRRHRQMDLVLESVATDPYEFTKLKARWEVNRRAGRGLLVTATVDSWRDSDGALWKPNTIVPVSLPPLPSGLSLSLAEVTFRRSNESGTTADLVMMPSYGFAPEPLVLQPVNLADIEGPAG